MAWGLISVGAVITLGSGVIGFVWLNRLPDLHPVSFGEQTQVTATSSAEATIFHLHRPRSDPCLPGNDAGRQARRAGCAAAVSAVGGHGVQPRLHHDIQYHLHGQLRGPGQAGQFGVAEVRGFPEVAFLAMGSLGLLSSATGGVVAWRRSRTTPAARPA
jgi:hypothetical protein